MVAVKHGGDLASGQGQSSQHSMLLGETVHSLINVVLDIGDLGDLEKTSRQKVASIAGSTRLSRDVVRNFHGFINCLLARVLISFICYSILCVSKLPVQLI